MTALSYVQARYLSPLMAELANDPRPPLCAAELLLSDKPLPSPWFKRGYDYNMVVACNWLEAHDLIQVHYEAKCQVWTWTRKGELYRARIRASGVTTILELWAWSKAGNAPSVWHHAHNGRPWP
jgi:hypothetical protein